MFTDSETVKGFSCGRTKTTQILKRAIAPSLNEDVINKMQSQPFSIMCDESNDQGGDVSSYYSFEPGKEIPWDCAG